MGAVGSCRELAGVGGVGPLKITPLLGVQYIPIGLSKIFKPFYEHKYEFSGVFMTNNLIFGHNSLEKPPES